MIGHSSIKRIPISNPLIGKEEKELVLKSLESGWISHRSPVVKEFESACDALGGMQRVAVSNGTVALDVLLRAVGVKAGDEVITSGLTYAATANAIMAVGATPRIADILEDTWQIDPASVESLITDQTKAILAVHLYGNVAPIAELVDIANKYSLILLFDSAEAHGAKYAGRAIGDFGHGSTVSFYANKLVTTGEGGLVLCNSDKLESRIRHLINHAQVNSKEFFHDEVGWNYRMPALSAAFGIGQIGRLASTIQNHEAILSEYKKNLAKFTYERQITWVVETQNARSVVWLTTLLIVKPGKSVQGLRSYLMKHGIETRPFFVPLTQLKYINSKELTPVANRIANSGICLPTFQGLATEDIQLICRFVADYLDSSEI